MVGGKTGKTIEKLFKSPLQRYQEALEESMNQSEFIFDSVNLLHYHFQKTIQKKSGPSSIGSPQ